MSDVDRETLFRLASLKGSRLPSDAEAAIAQSPKIAFKYLKKYIHEPWPKGEDAIATNTRMAYYYAGRILKGRFPKGEKNLLDYSEDREKNTIGEKMNFSILYADHIIKGRWPEFEEAILSKQKHENIAKRIYEPLWVVRSFVISYGIYYVETVIKGRWSGFEEMILSLEPAEVILQGSRYAQKIKGRWPEWEEKVRKILEKNVKKNVDGLHYDYLGELYDYLDFADITMKDLFKDYPNGDEIISAMRNKGWG